MTETGGGAGPGVGTGSVPRAFRPAMTGLLTIAAVWLTWWVAATLTYSTGHAEAAYLVVFIGGPIAVLTTLVALVVVGVRVCSNLLRRRRTAD